MAEQSPDYKKLFLEEHRKRKDAEHAREEEQRRREEEQRKREAAESAQRLERYKREEAEEKTRKTTLPEFLDACHNHLHSGLTVQTDATLSTRGDPANANNKLRPERLVAWDDFPAQQATNWEDLMASDFVLERHFTSLHTLEESGEAIRRRMMSSELDLHLFQRHTVEDHVSLIKFGLQGSIRFENHANTLSPESQLEDSMEQLTVSGTRRRRSPRLQAKAKAKEINSFIPTDPTEPVVAARAARSSRPSADQFCVYNINGQNTENRVAAFIMEYKAPHKLPLGYVYEGLEDMDLEDVIRCQETDTPRHRCRRLMAAVITQAFSYMIKIGSEYGCVCTGEAFVFLRVPDDPRTVHYFLSVPKGDVGATTGWVPDSDNANRLHLTAVGQMLAFTLTALKTPPRSQKWRVEAAAQLNNWEVVYDDLLDTIAFEDAPSSEYRPPRHNVYLRMSPIQLRRRPVLPSSPSCWQSQNQREASDEDPDPDTPSQQRPSLRVLHRTQPIASNSTSRNPRQGARGGQYCTQKCLLGLVKGGPIDTACPNVRYHGRSCHRINLSNFLDRIRQQLSEDLDRDCQPVGVPGACGVLFRVRLKSHGYVVAAKCAPVDFVHRLEWESAIYRRLRSIQGIHVPVHLGNIGLKTPYFYEGIAELVHMMFLSFGGKCISEYRTSKNKAYIARQVDCSVQAIHDLGVLHKDLEPRNILWSQETSQAMVIDFERAQIVQPRTALVSISANRKRTRRSEASSVKQSGNGISLFARERQRTMNNLWGWPSL
ncbi:hypothetical protein BS50DRAFT_607293 [Corynespora cassiicola Philippines]|uniref:Protein kinase domain-containing protein n=1 Tax=Corynespora cassiicola Philippines TaxID=1448308 RepID=A0A2T2P809_CORCC|nr:hypothetical protein BS50DRAFT_607293 [Corynespora cassiicola Philippines]